MKHVCLLSCLLFSHLLSSFPSPALSIALPLSVCGGECGHQAELWAPQVGLFQELSLFLLIYQPQMLLSGTAMPPSLFRKALPAKQQKQKQLTLVSWLFSSSHYVQPLVWLKNQVCKTGLSTRLRCLSSAVISQWTSLLWELTLQLVQTLIDEVDINIKGWPCSPEQLSL